MEFKKIDINTDEIAEYVYKRMTDYGYIITDNESQVLADVFFDYLIDKDIIEEEE